jgi:DNA mismatch repair protein MutL
LAGRIHKLPDGIVNRIAAGEVVERPASVLKELLENAVDAGASRIEAEVSGSFPFTVRVTDDGCGMTAEEAETAILRHTTSKIVTADDLQRIATYGFRGEALPSIAAVARLRIVTRPAGRPLATEIVVEGGKILDRREAGAPLGTTVEVSHLFANVPARLKFLKSPRTEIARLRDVFHGVAVPREGIAFRLRDAGGETTVYEASEPPLDRAQSHAGGEAAYLVRIGCASPFYRLFGWTGLPHLSRAAGTGLKVFVNGRHVRDRALAAAVREAYRGILPPDRLPVAYLFIACDPAEVDVNVHPAKTEARFRYSRELFELVRYAIAEALGEAHVPYRAEPVAAPPVPTGEPPHPAAGGNADGPPLRTAGGSDRPLFPEPSEGDLPGLHLSPPGEIHPLPGGRFSTLRPVGQLLGTYIVCEGAGCVVILDQHAGHERIVFSRLKDAFLGGEAPVQHWLVPQVVALPGAAREERAVLREFLARAGFVFEPLGEDAFRITGGPAILGAFDVRTWWRDLCDFVDDQGSAPKGILDADRELWRMACHGSIRAGDPLDTDGIRRFLVDLDRAVAAHSCPHGRPIWVRISGPEMGRMFGRD